jgi:hypothetical protein
VTVLKGPSVATTETLISIGPGGGVEAADSSARRMVRVFRPQRVSGFFTLIQSRDGPIGRVRSGGFARTPAPDYSHYRASNAVKTDATQGA